MPEKKETNVRDRFLTVFGDKISDGEQYDPLDDQCDQRAPVNDPQELYNTFVVSEDVMSELEAEKVEDFENDIYDYDDRTDLGLDIAASASLDLVKSKSKLMKRKEKAAEDLEKVPDAADEPSEA